jgi:hypothetical protein
LWVWILDRKHRRMLACRHSTLVMSNRNKDAKLSKDILHGIDCKLRTVFHLVRKSCVRESFTHCGSAKMAAAQPGRRMSSNNFNGYDEWADDISCLMPAMDRANIPKAMLLYATVENSGWST